MSRPLNVNDCLSVIRLLELIASPDAAGAMKRTASDLKCIKSAVASGKVSVLTSDAKLVPCNLAFFVEPGQGGRLLNGCRGLVSLVHPKVRAHVAQV